MNRTNLERQKEMRTTHVQVNLSELSVAKPKRSTASFQHNYPSSSQGSSRSSRFMAAVKESVASVAKTIARFVLIQNDDGCNLRGCRIFIWINGVLLFIMGLVLLLAWVDISFGILTGEKYFKDYFVPNWSVLKEPQYFTACWVHMFICAAWILTGAFLRSETLMRAYSAIVPWSLAIPISFCLYYVLYIGRINEKNTETILYERIRGDMSTHIDLDTWDELQNHFQCCGIKGIGWKDWKDANEYNDIYSTDIFPMSCCKNTPGFQKLCQHYPEHFVHKKTCTSFISRSYNAMGSFVITSLVMSMTAIGYSIFSATRFYWFLIQNKNKPTQSKASRCCLECMCPCLICRKRYQVAPQGQRPAVPPTPSMSMEKIKEDMKLQKSMKKKEQEFTVLHANTAQVQSSDEEMNPLSSIPPDRPKNEFVLN